MKSESARLTISTNYYSVMVQVQTPIRTILVRPELESTSPIELLLQYNAS